VEIRVMNWAPLRLAICSHVLSCLILKLISSLYQFKHNQLKAEFVVHWGYSSNQPFARSDSLDMLLHRMSIQALVRQVVHLVHIKPNYGVLTDQEGLALGSPQNGHDQVQLFQQHCNVVFALSSERQFCRFFNSDWTIYATHDCNSIFLTRGWFEPYNYLNF
jgi:hypothetical protein